jgi:hypothetical protein
MGISVYELSNRYPVLYHMATADSWKSIEQHGLLSSADLLRLFEVPEDLQITLLTSQRRDGVLISHHEHGAATLRDQKPLSQKKLERCLTDCDAPTWYRLLNERVFFWLTRERLVKLMSAKEYVGKVHTVLSINTSSLLRQYEGRVELAHMNTGNTLPFAHPRGKATFKTLELYPYEQRKPLSDYSAVVELTVLGGVPDLKRHVLKAEHATVANGSYLPIKTLYDAK